MRTINLSSLSASVDTYTCQHEWPANCHVQAGDSGIVFTNDGSGSYRTAFFEAFPRSPDTFIRGEGETVAAAEESAWKKYQAIVACTGHEFERHGYPNGCGTCKHCGLFATDVFEPTTLCVTCGVPSYFAFDVDGNEYCEAHQRDKPLDKWSNLDWMMARSMNTMWNWDHKERTEL